MHDFDYTRLSDPDEVAATLADRPGARIVAGGTELINLLKEGIETPEALIDINEADLDFIRSGPDGLRLGALTRLSDVADDAVVTGSYPVLAQALESSASPQLRNMATLGGNLLQRTRGRYFRAETSLPCNKRRPGSGCAVVDDDAPTAALFGGSEHCRATHPSDLAVALTALEARIRLRSTLGERSVDLAELYRLPGDQPEHDTILHDDDLITEITVPSSTSTTTSCYLKLRERASYEFALLSAAVTVDLTGEYICSARIALGGVAPRPWRLPAAERALVGARLSEAALREAVEPSFDEARATAATQFKVELAKRTVVRAVLTAGGTA